MQNLNSCDLPRFKEFPIIQFEFPLAPCNAAWLVQTPAWLGHAVKRQTAVREVEGSSPRPDQHSGSEYNWGECAAFAMTPVNG